MKMSGARRREGEKRETGGQIGRQIKGTRGGAIQTGKSRLNVITRDVKKKHQF